MSSILTALLWWVVQALATTTSVTSVTSVDLITTFYRQMDLHFEWQHISSILCDKHYIVMYPHSGNLRFQSSALYSNSVYQNHTRTHFNEHHISYNPAHAMQASMHMSPSAIAITVSVEYSALMYHREHMPHSECVHYNFSANVTINSASNCISRISNTDITHFFPDHGLKVCQPDAYSYNDASQVQPRVLLASDIDDDNSSTSAAYVATEFTVDFFDHTNLLLMLVGSWCCLSWCTFYILYHMALLHFPHIFYTKICIFTIFLSALANITISVLIVDPFSFIPNAICIILCMLQFTKYAYDLQFDFTAAYCAEFVTFGPRKQIASAMQESVQLQGKITQAAHAGHALVPSNDHSTGLQLHAVPSISLAASPASDDTVSSASSQFRSRQPSQIRSRVTPRYRGRGNEASIVKIVSICFVLASVLTHFVVLFISEEAEKSGSDLRQVRFDQTHGLLLLQWLVCLSVMIAWFQNLRFEYAFEQLLAEGCSLYYQSNTHVATVSEEQISLAASNDSNVLNLGTGDSESEEDTMEMSAPSACCKCLHGCSLNVVKRIRFLPWLLCVNGVCWIVFGIFICKLEILWLQHALSVGVGGIYVVVSLCMNEKNLILAKKAAVMQQGGDHDTAVKATEPQPK